MKYRVTAFHIVEANNPLEAAQKGFILNDEMTPVEYEVSQEGGDEETDFGFVRVELSEQDIDEARSMQVQGKFFRTTNLKD